jgi:hypothetical protein
LYNEILQITYLNFKGSDNMGSKEAQKVMKQMHNCDQDEIEQVFVPGAEENRRKKRGSSAILKVGIFYSLGIEPEQLSFVQGNSISKVIFVNPFPSEMWHEDNSAILDKLKALKVDSGGNVPAVYRAEIEWGTHPFSIALFSLAYLMERIRVEDIDSGKTEIYLVQGDLSDRILKESGVDVIALAKNMLDCKPLKFKTSILRL